MFEAVPYLWQYFVQAFGLFIAYAFAGVLFIWFCGDFIRDGSPLHSSWFFWEFLLRFMFRTACRTLFEYPFSLKTYGPAEGPVIPFKNVWEFFKNFDRFERVKDIARDPADIPPPINRAEPAVVEINLTAKEVIAEMAPGVTFNYWTFDGTVPGPFLRVREGGHSEIDAHE